MSGSGRAPDPVPGAPGGPSDPADVRAAVDDLVGELRRLLVVLAGTTAPADVVARAVESIAGATRALQSYAADDTGPGPGLFGAAGLGNPLVPDLEYEPTATGGRGCTTLGRAHAGHPRISHGGITAMLLDEVLGRAAVLPGTSSVTSRLSVSYRRPVPLHRPLVITATRGDRSGPRLEMTGTVALADDPGRVLVEAHGTWFHLPPDRVGSVLGSG